MGRDRRPSADLCVSGAQARGRDACQVVVLENSILDSGDYGLAAAHVHSLSHQDFNIRGHKQVCPRAELDPGKAFAAFYPLAALLPTDDSPSQHAGNLNALNGNVFAGDGQGVLLVQQTGIRARRHHKFARFVGNIDDFTLDGRSVNVYVKGRKKNADQRFWVLAICRTDNRHLSVCRSYDDSGFKWNRSPWVTEKESHKARERQKCHRGNPKKREPEKGRDHQDKREQSGKNYVWNSVANHWNDLWLCH